jgi:hypothetical protein
MSAVQTTHPLRAAMEARDRAAVVAAFAPDAVLRSPFTDNLAFEGHERIGALVEVIFDELHDLRYTDELRGDRSTVLVGQARVDRMPLTFTDHLRLRDDGLIQEMTVFFRPLPASTAAMRHFGERLGRQKSGFRGRLIGALVAPLAFMSRTGDKLGTRLLSPDGRPRGLPPPGYGSNWGVPPTRRIRKKAVRYSPASTAISRATAAVYACSGGVP